MSVLQELLNFFLTSTSITGVCTCHTQTTNNITLCTWAIILIFIIVLATR